MQTRLSANQSARAILAILKKALFTQWRIALRGATKSYPVESEPV